MTHDELKTEISNAGYTYVDEKVIGDDENIPHTERAVRIYKQDTDSVQYTGFHVFVDKQSGEYFFQGNRPSILVTQDTNTFSDRVNDLIAEKMNDGTVEFASVEGMNQQAERALVTAQMPDGTEQKVIVTTDTDGNLQLNTS